jgi:hypothetical protein
MTSLVNTAMNNGFCPDTFYVRLGKTSSKFQRQNLCSEVTQPWPAIRDAVEARGRAVNFTRSRILAEKCSSLRPQAHATCRLDSTTNPHRMRTLCFFTTFFNIILSSTPRSPKTPFPFRFSTKRSYEFNVHATYSLRFIPLTWRP